MKKAIPLPSLERLEELFSYSVVTGELYRKVQTAQRTKAGDVAGSVNKVDGYRRIVVDSQMYKASRLIWKLVTGEDPLDSYVDHIDGNRSNDSWHNLRLVTLRQNAWNVQAHRDSKSGVKGVVWSERHRNFRAEIMANGCKRHLGVFPTAAEAAAAYAKAAKQLHGDYARTS